MTLPREPLALATRRTTVADRRWNPARVREVLDALGRRQRELPAWALAEAIEDPPVVRECDARAAAVERALLESRLGSLLDAPAPRALVHLGAPAPLETADALPDALVVGTTIERVVVGDLAAAPAARLASALRARHPGLELDAVVTDATVDLALPRRLPRPRLHFCPGSALGRFGTVGAIRMLRVVRASMTRGDRLALLLDLRRGREAVADPTRDADGIPEARHRRALALVAHALGASLDVGDFDWCAVWDDEAHRLDTQLVARRAMRVAIPGTVSLVLRRGESIRTSVDTRFDRVRLASMLAGVGLHLADWSTDASGGRALAIVTPA